MEKEQVIEKVYEILSWFKKHNIGMNQGDNRILRLLGGYNIRYEAIDYDDNGNLVWMLWMYKEGCRWYGSDYELRFEGVKLMKRWVVDIVDYLWNKKK